MKLYATIQSERAKKGQGGNQFINIDLLVGDAKNPIDAGRIAMKTTGNIFWIDYFTPHNLGQSFKRTELFVYEKPEQKGKQQKGESYCLAQVGEQLCSNRVYKDNYCLKHFKMFNE